MMYIYVLTEEHGVIKLLFGKLLHPPWKGAPPRSPFDV